MAKLRFDANQDFFSMFKDATHIIITPYSAGNILMPQFQSYISMKIKFYFQCCPGGEYNMAWNNHHHPRYYTDTYTFATHTTLYSVRSIIMMPRLHLIENQNLFSIVHLLLYGIRGWGWKDLIWYEIIPLPTIIET